jgi:hypothetical protein
VTFASQLQALHERCAEAEVVIVGYHTSLVRFPMESIAEMTPLDVLTDEVDRLKRILLAQDCRQSEYILSSISPDWWWA